MLETHTGSKRQPLLLVFAALLLSLALVSALWYALGNQTSFSNNSPAMPVATVVAPIASAPTIAPMPRQSQIRVLGIAAAGGKGCDKEAIIDVEEQDPKPFRIIDRLAPDTTLLEAGPLDSVIAETGFRRTIEVDDGAQANSQRNRGRAAQAVPADSAGSADGSLAPALSEPSQAPQSRAAAMLSPGSEVFLSAWRRSEKRAEFQRTKHQKLRSRPRDEGKGLAGDCGEILEACGSQGGDNGADASLALSCTEGDV